MTALLLAVIYLTFVSLGLPDSLLGSAWPTMQGYFDVPSSWAGYISMTITCMTVVSSLLAPGLQMASAYLGAALMPMVFGHIQQHFGIGLMPLYLTVFAVLNLALLEAAYKQIEKSKNNP